MSRSTFGPMVPLWHHAERAKVPAAKSVPVRVVKDESAHDDAEAPWDMVSGHPLTDVGRHVIRAGGLALNAAKARPVKAAAVALAAAFALGLMRPVTAARGLRSNA